MLRVGDYFIGTTVESCQLVRRCRDSPEQSISNSVFSIKFDSSINLSTTSNEKIPLFGAKYHFTLDDVVDCPEYLVYFPLLEKLAEKHGLEISDRQTFKDYFNKNKDTRDGRHLFSKIKALKYYEPPANGPNQQRGSPMDHDQYTHAAKYIEDKSREHPNSPRCCRTLSKQDWDMTSLYIIFAFKKIRHVKYDEDTIVNQ